jgi:2-dehydropantoate 2-reductase
MNPANTSGTAGPFSITDGMKILVMGAGAIGAFYGAWLQRAGDEVYFCARGEHLRALQASGLEVKSVDGDFQLAVKASSDPREFAPYELILFCVKSQDTISAGKQLAGCLAEGGALLTLQNGVENEARLCEIFPREQVMGGNARVGAEITAPGKLLHTVGGNAEIGELDGRKTPRALRIAESFRRAGVLGELTEDLLTLRWHKLMGNNGTTPFAPWAAARWARRLRIQTAPRWSASCSSRRSGWEGPRARS